MSQAHGTAPPGARSSLRRSNSDVVANSTFSGTPAARTSTRRSRCTHAWGTAMRPSAESAPRPTRGTDNSTRYRQDRTEQILAGHRLPVPLTAREHWRQRRLICAHGIRVTNTASGWRRSIMTSRRRRKKTGVLIGKSKTPRKRFRFIFLLCALDHRDSYHSLATLGFVTFCKVDSLE